MTDNNNMTAREIYADIIDLPHHVSTRRKHMSNYDRAAQFAPFAALTGYDEAVDRAADEVFDSDEKRKALERENDEFMYNSFL